MKFFIITVDTEGDDLWHWKDGNEISTNNSVFIPRFQELCEKYKFKPTYLTNYEMANDFRWVEYAKKKLGNDLCEIGMHIHAWNSPPYFELENKFGGNAYISEYPKEIVFQKIITLKKLLNQRFETDIISCRSGRWATNNDYFEALLKAGVIVDCSVTPGIDLSPLPGRSVQFGNNYSSSKETTYEIYPGLLEVPMTTRKIRWISEGSIKHRAKSIIFGEEMWLRPHTKSLNYLKRITSQVEGKSEYLEFMIHSSELMPGGSPYFNNQEDIEMLFAVLDDYFNLITRNGYIGITLGNYARGVMNGTH